MTDQEGFLRTIQVPPDRDTLRQISKITQGRFFEAKDAGKLDAIYDRLGSRIGYATEKRELTAAFAGGGPRIAARRRHPLVALVRPPALTGTRG